MAEYAYVAKDTIADPGASATKGYYFGGYNTAGTTYLKATESLLDTTWTVKADMPDSSVSATGRARFAASPISSKAYVYGGHDAGVLNDTDEYDPSDNTWTGKANLPDYGRNRLAATTIGVKGYILGGWFAAGLQDCDEYDASGNSWANKTDMPAPGRRSLVAGTIGLSAFVFGGYDGSDYLQDTDRYSQTADAWSSKQDMLLGGRTESALFRIGEALYVLGGTEDGSAAEGDCDKYEIDTWITSVPIMRVDRFAGAGFTIGEDGYVLGGLPGVKVGLFFFFTECDKYDGTSWTDHSTLAARVAEGPAAVSI